ncbi:MAG: DUF1549 domain-containing protein, partial [Planctomycetales bacterium]|nr:DUF1549 domain-containing protein [Planctomycetales bacterium]
MTRPFLRRCTGSLAILLLVAVGAADAAAPWAKLDVYPPDVNLTTSRDMQRVIAVATRADGVTVDVTKQAKFTLADPALAKIDGNTLYPQADGETALQVEAEGLSVSVPVKVAHAAEDRPVSFKLDVMPVFMRTGCNTGSCHGSARGKDGFRLSLFGFDPEGDHFRLTREAGARRVNLAVPQDSLLMEKATGAVAHTGGKQMTADSEYYATMIRWLAAGVPEDPADIATVESLEIFPPAAVIEGKDSIQQFLARAKYSDGTDRDVTSLTLFGTSNDNSAPITEDGLVTAAARGEAFISARFNVHTVGSQVLVLPAELAYTQPTEQPVNYVDELVGAKLHKLRVEPSGLCSDEEFLRRITIDVVGSLPTPEEYNAFLADQDPEKRRKKIDELLERKAFAEIWAMKWAELLMVKTVQNQVEYKPMLLYSTWLTSQIENNVPLDKMVQEVLASTGGTFSSPATNFYQVERDTLKVSENVAQIFMGMRTQCAQCHNHPFDRWTMDDYYGFAAFFSQIGRKTGEDYRETIVFNQGGGEVKHPVSGKNMAPKFLGGDVPDVAGKDRRRVLAEWIASPENPFFATSVANRV